MYQKGSIFGEERFLREQAVSSYSVTCHSLEGEVYRISSIEFLRKIQIVAETKRLILKNLQKKEERINLKPNQGVNWKSQSSQTPSDQPTLTQQSNLNQKFNRFLLSQKFEFRDTLKEIVEGYPEVQRILGRMRTNKQNVQQKVSKLSLAHLDKQESSTEGDQEEQQQITKRCDNMRVPRTTVSSNRSSLKALNQQFRQSVDSYKASLNQISFPQRHLSSTQNDWGSKLRDKPRQVKYVKTTNTSPRTSKDYISSNIIQAMLEVKQQTKEEEQKRHLFKEQLKLKKRNIVIDETTFASQERDNQDNTVDTVPVVNVLRDIRSASQFGGLTTPFRRVNQSFKNKRMMAWTPQNSFMRTPKTEHDISVTSLSRTTSNLYKQMHLDILAARSRQNSTTQTQKVSASQHTCLLRHPCMLGRSPQMQVAKTMNRGTVFQFKRRHQQQSLSSRGFYL